MKRIAILGSTGSIGRSALAVVDAHPSRLKVVALAAGANVPLLAEQAVRYDVDVVAASSEASRDDLARRMRRRRTRVLAPGSAGLIEAATHADADLVLCASSGTAGLEAVLAAIDAGKSIALANKEVLVMAGALMIEAAHRRGVTVLPVDSEHNAIHQCLHRRRREEVRRLILTASGGPFLTRTSAELGRVTPADALRHPTWQMGRKITIDSATLMNKGLEVIEARWLFGVGPKEIDVLVHPQSIVHSMVELRDGSVIAQLSVTDMRLPIQYAFSYPDRWDGSLPPLDLARLGALEFQAPDLDRFPCLRLAYEALEHGGVWPIVLNAANEIAVEAFLEGRIPLPAIPATIERALRAADRSSEAPRTLDAVREIDGWARAFSRETLGTLPSS